MASYVKAKGSDTWHWCRNCSRYPSGPDVEKSTSKPQSGELCNECRAKQARGDCRS